MLNEQISEFAPTTTTLASIITTRTTPSYPHDDKFSVNFLTYIIILLSATAIVLIWAFFIFFFFSRGGGRRNQFFSHSTSSSLRTSIASDSSVYSIKSDLPPKYENAIDVKIFPSVVVLESRAFEERKLEDAPPKYYDVVEN